MRKKEDEKALNPKKEPPSPINIISVGIGQSEIVQIHGEANSQIIQAYSGKRFDSAGNELLHKGRSLKQISQYKVNPDYAEQNLKAQAGFSAELLEEANQNREAILRGDPARRRTTDGLGKTNDTQYDLVTVDQAGNISDPMQIKFLGVDKKGRYAVIEKLAKDKSWDRYDTTIGVPIDQYEGAVAYANNQANELLNQAKELRAKGKIDAAVEREKLAEKYKAAADRIKPTSVSEKDALLARKQAKKYVAKTMVKNAHAAGVDAAKGAVLVGGTVSIAQNICAIYSGDVTVEQAAENVIKTTARAGITAYGVGSAGSLLKSAMHTSNNQVVRQLGTTTLPTMVVTSALEIGSVVKSYASGEISETEAFTRLGKSGTGSLAASYGAAVGTVLLPGIGTIVGSMVGYMVSSAIYDSCLQILVEADLAYENYIRTRELCAEARKTMEQQRLEFEAKVNHLIAERQIAIDNSIFAIMDSIDSSDTDNLNIALSTLASSFGRDLQFKTFGEFDDFMSNSSDSFKF